MQLDGRWVLVTGASGGLGAAIVRAVAKKGARVRLTGRKVDVLEALAREIGGVAIAVDLADRAALARLAAESQDVDVLVANAALPGSGRITDLGEAAIDQTLDVNLRAPMLLARALVPAMLGRGRGHVVFVNSLSGKAASPRTSLYGATKFGLRGFALALAEDLHDSPVGVSSVFPGFIRDAGMFADSGVTLPPGVGTRAPDDVARAVVEAIETGRVEIDVAPPALRLGAWFAGVAPRLSATVQRWAGAGELADAIAAKQRAKSDAGR